MDHIFMGCCRSLLLIIYILYIFNIIYYAIITLQTQYPIDRREKRCHPPQPLMSMEAELLNKGSQQKSISAKGEQIYI